eukprot:scaffold269174_cov35-Tisochrysis_lutea.AAC.1
MALAPPTSPSLALAPLPVDWSWLRALDRVGQVGGGRRGWSKRHAGLLGPGRAIYARISGRVWA